MKFFNCDLSWGFYPVANSSAQIACAANEKLWPARIVGSSHEIYHVLPLGSSTEQVAILRGKLRAEGEIPVVGDWVLILRDLQSSIASPVAIEALLPRKSTITRQTDRGEQEVIMANVDYLLLTTSFNTDLNFNRLERMKTMAIANGISPVIVVNKIDLLDPDLAKQTIADIQSRLKMDAVFGISALSSQGLLDLFNHFSTGDTLAVLGMSGVGKSTLTNQLLKSASLMTKEIRDSDSRGQHTTTSRRLFRINEKFWLMDTPGMRTYVIDGNTEAAQESFQDVADLLSQCQFSNCQHRTEPKCAIREALRTQTLSHQKWENFQKLQSELRVAERKASKLIENQERKKWEKKSQHSRTHSKLKRSAQIKDE